MIGHRVNIQQTPAKPVTNKTNDNRPYANIKIFDVPIQVLLDSGATQSLAGSEGVEILSKFKCPRSDTSPRTVATADKTIHTVTGAFLVPVEFNRNIQLIGFLSVPSLSCSFILGIDFWKSFSIKLSINQDIWQLNTLTTDLNTRNSVVEAEELDDAQKIILANVVDKFRQLAPINRLGRTTIMEHEINTGDALPTAQRCHPVSPPIQDRMHKELQRMIDLGVAEPSNSPWRSPVLLVKKANGSDRLCINPKKVNAVTIFDSYPLPNISSILDRLGKANYLSSIDLKDAFWQIPLKPESREKTAFAIPGKGLFQLKVVGFGFRNSSACMQRLMDRLCGDRFFPYLDDIVIPSETFEQHMADLRFLFERLKWANLTINFEKSKFCRPSLKYLGFVVDKLGLHTDPDKVTAILNFERPKNTTEVRRLIGLASWYRRFVKDFASVVAPINDLIKNVPKGKPVKWNDKADQAFIKLKSLLTTPPVLVSPDFNKPFTIHCDASNEGIGAVICQGDDERPIAYASRKYTNAEAKYSITERECLAASFGVEKFRPYVEGAFFKLITDHSALLYLLKNEKLPNDRLTRWVLRFAPYNFEIIHRKGSSNIVPDILSRNFPNNENPQENVIKEACALAVDSPFSFIFPDQLCTNSVTRAHLSVIDFAPSAQDVWYNEMLAKVKAAPTEFPNWITRQDKLYIKFQSRDSMHHFWQYKIVVPESARALVLHECHDIPSAGHLGIKKTRNRILQRYFWPRVSKDTELYVKNCVICRESKSTNTKKQGLMGRPKVAQLPFQMLAIDFMGPLTKSTKQNHYLFVISDWLSKFPSLFALREATAAKVIAILEKEIFLTYGIPETIIADNAKVFTCKAFMEFLNKYNVRIRYNSYYHPQHNFVERTNKTIGNMLRCYCRDNHRHWDARLPELQLALRTATNEITGYTPYFLVFGREFMHNPVEYSLLLNCSSDIHIAALQDRTNHFKLVLERIRSNHAKNKAVYDKKRTHKEFEVGDVVFRRVFGLSDASKNISAKLLPRFEMNIIAAKHSALSYELVDMNSKPMGNYHIKDIFEF